MIQLIKKWFSRKKIVHSKHMMPGIFVRRIKGKNGKIYVRIKYTNRKKYADKMPITDVLLSDVTHIRVLPWAWWESLCRRKGWKINEKIIVINR